MRKLLALLPAVTALALTAAAPAPAVAATHGAASPSRPAVTLARFGGSRGFGRGFGRAPSYGSRGRYRSPGYYRRPRPFHGLGGAILRGLGIAYLFHALFGWGPGGGSPIGLLIIVAFVAWLVLRRPRRPLYS